MGSMGDEIYDFSTNAETMYKIYPTDRVMKRDFVEEFSHVRPGYAPEITILTIFCGRFHCLAPYLWSLGNLDYDTKKIHLLFYCSAPHKIYYNLLSRAVKRLGGRYASVRLVWDKNYPPSELSHSEKGGNVSLHLDNIPKLYNKAMRMVNTRYLFSFEDDQVSPSHIIKRYLRLIRLNKVATVCGVAFDRHHTNSVVAFDFYMQSSSGKLKGVQVGRRFCLTPVGSGGMGSTIVDNEEIRGIDITHALASEPYLLGADVCLGYQVNRKGSVVLYDWDVHSYHIDSQNRVL